MGKLTAIDRDIGRNAELIFTLSNVQDDFTIDPRNGFIKTMHEFDRESLVQSTGQPFVLLEAIVSDNGVVRLKDKVKVKIIISDVNDNAPQFIRAPYKVQISEGNFFLNVCTLKNKILGNEKNLENILRKECSLMGAVC